MTRLPISSVTTNKRISAAINRIARRCVVWWLGRANRRAGATSLNQYSATIIKADRMGDFLLAKPAIELVLEKFGEDRCLIIVSKHSEEFARLLFPRTHLLVVPSFLGHLGALRVSNGLRKNLRGISPGACVCLRHDRTDYDELIISWLAPGSCTRLRDEDGKIRWKGASSGLYKSPIPGAFSTQAACESLDLEQVIASREIRRHFLTIQRFLGIDISLEQLLPSLPAIENEHGIVVCPHGSDPIRDVPYLLLERVVITAFARIGHRVTLIGSPNRALFLADMALKLRRHGLPIDVADSLTTAEFVRRVSSARLVITAETAAAHIATAANRYAVIFIGGGHYGQFGPWQRSARQCWLTHEMECFGCDWMCKYIVPHCLTDVSLAHAQEAVQKLLCP